MKEINKKNAQQFANQGSNNGQTIPLENANTGGNDQLVSIHGNVYSFVLLEALVVACTGGLVACIYSFVLLEALVACTSGLVACWACINLRHFSLISETNDAKK
jgi:hypothetical protein